MNNNVNSNVQLKVFPSWVIAICFALWFLIIPPIIGIVLIIVQHNQISKIKAPLKELDVLRENADKYATEVRASADEYNKSKRKEADDYNISIHNDANEYLKNKCAETDRYCETKIKYEQERLDIRIAKVTDENFIALQEKLEDAEKKLASATKKTEKLSYVFRAIKNYIDKFNSAVSNDTEIRNIERMVEEVDIENLMEPTIEIKLHSDDIKELRRKFREVNKIIDDTLAEYERRYNTKANVAIYRLMVVALRSELQNVLYTMKYGKLEDAENSIKEICDKYLKIAGDGNQSIAPTLGKFIAETQSLFTDAARIEYEYYMRKERAKEEQKALREQMRQEAEERKALEQQKKQIEKEESKYNAEMEKLREQLEAANDEKAATLNARIEELEKLLAQVDEKKEDIAKLQNGKAGYVYVISNLGSFGEHVFKIGMTRRLEPQERVNELGDASVPFPFDVHSFIFSEDAPALETSIHNRLNKNRLNKVNLRKEFFDISLDELETLVYELEPSAEFNRTMAAEQYRQSLSMTELFTEFEADNEDE